MNTSEVQAPLNEASPSVQTHLQIMQAVIQRMAANSTSCKTWCITVVSAVLVIVADKGKPNFAHLAFIPTLLFLALDAYYLGLEKGFRASYAVFVKRLHSGVAKPVDLYAIVPDGSRFKHLIEALRSFSVWGFYATLAVLIELARSTVLR